MKTALNEEMKFYLAEIAKNKVLTREEEVKLFQRLKAGDTSAREEIVEANLRFVVKIAIQFAGRGVALPDLIQEGNIGLLEVIDKFDYKKGYRFSTYAAFWIRQAIQMALRKQSNVIRLPIRKSRFLGHLNEAINNFSNNNGRTPTVSELSAVLNVEENKLEQLLSMRESVLSLDAEDDEEGGQLLSRLHDDSSLSPYEQYAEKEMSLHVEAALNTLSDKEKNVLKLRYGFDGGVGMSLRSTSKVVGMSQEGVRRVERSAIRKLRRPAVSEMVTGLI